MKNPLRERKSSVAKRRKTPNRIKGEAPWCAAPLTSWARRTRRVLTPVKMREVMRRMFKMNSRRASSSFCDRGAISAEYKKRAPPRTTCLRENRCLETGEKGVPIFLANPGSGGCSGSNDKSRGGSSAACLVVRKDLFDQICHIIRNIENHQR